MQNPVRTHKVTWLHGPAGVGKSAVIQTLAESESDSHSSILGATLFFSRPAQRNDPQKLFNTIAYQLAVKYQPYRQYIVGLLAADSRVVKKSMVEQFKQFIVRPFGKQRLLEGSAILVTLDGLDECEGEPAQREIIFFITEFSLQYPNTPLIWIIASRPEPQISSAFSRQDIQGNFLDIDMPIDSDQACADVEHFLRDIFAEIRENYSASFSPEQQWPTETQFVKVATKASGLFVFANTVIRFVDDVEYGNPVAQLQVVIDILDTRLVVGAQENPFLALDALYTHILSGVSPRVLPVLRKLQPLFIRSTREFAVACNILAISQADAYSALRKLHSVVKVPPPEQAGSVALGVFHASFTDFLCSSARSGTFWVDLLEGERLWTSSCIRLLLEAHDPGECPRIITDIGFDLLLPP